MNNYLDDLIELEMCKRLRQVREALIEERKATQKLIIKALPDPNIIDVETDVIIPKEEGKGQD